MNDLAERVYVGDGQCRYEALDTHPREGGLWPEHEPYIADQSLANAVNVALYLRRPLLLEGEPGCGKTRLAYAIAHELGYPLYACYIRSTSQAQDLLYEYDALQRLYDLQEEKLASNQDNPTNSQENGQIPREKYVTLGKLGQAIEKSDKEDIPSVVLIDEIDKADIDFPNDLLLQLDRLQFEVKEVSDMKFDALKGESRSERKDFLPLIIITSNKEKELPKPFLRRCLFYFIEFPNEDILRKIIDSHSEEFIKSPFQARTEPPQLTPLFEAAIEKFLALRELKFWRKIAGTSEFLDWVKVLEREQIKASELKKTPLKDLPHLETLVKTQSDHVSLTRFSSEG